MQNTAFVIIKEAWCEHYSAGSALNILKQHDNNEKIRHIILHKMPLQH